MREISGVGGKGFTTTARAGELAEHPFESVTQTEYVPAAKTVIPGVVALLLHRYELAGLAVSITESPWQNVVGPLAVMVATGIAFTLTNVAGELEAQPFESVTRTE